LESGFKLPIDVFRPKDLDGVTGRRALLRQQ
jgi:hypothetical protein